LASGDVGSELHGDHERAQHRDPGPDHRRRLPRHRAHELGGDAKSSVGIWTTASRRKARVLDSSGGTGSRNGTLRPGIAPGQPLFNEVLVPLSEGQVERADHLQDDKDYAAGVAHPELSPDC
jgi:hypothetical protein